MNTEVVITIKNNYSKDFNKIHTYLLKNNIKVVDFLKNYLVLFCQIDKNNKIHANIINYLKTVADIEEKNV